MSRIGGIHRAIVNRVWSMAKAIGIEGQVTMTGGVAKNRGVAALMGQKLEKPIRIFKEPQIIGALGAALIVKKHCSR